MSKNETVHFWLKPYEDEFNNAIKSKKFLKKTELVREALRNYFYGKGGLPEELVLRLERHSKALGRPVHVIISGLLDRYESQFEEKK